MVDDRPAAFDHLVVAVPDVEEARSRLATELGVPVERGGRHRHLGTRNALAGLEGDRYLELIGPDTEGEAPAHPRPFGVDEVTAPALATWAVRTADLDGCRARVLGAGVDLGPADERSRTTPDGASLRWRMTSATADRLGGVVPFLLDWGTTPRPSQRLGAELRIEAFRVQHPEPAVVGAVLAALGLTDVVADLRPGPARLTVELAGPAGHVTLSGP